MKYYSIANDFDHKVIGSYPQSESMADHYYYKKEDSVWNLRYDNDFAPNLDAIQLVREAKLTDMLSVVVISSLAGKIISENFKDLLHNFRLPSHHFFAAKVIDSRKQEIKDKQYFLFRVLEYQNRHIDFDRSEFYVHRRGIGEVDQINIYSADDLEKTPEEHGLGIGQSVKPRFITLSPDVNYDIFSFRRFAGYFVSERLKAAIEAAGLTGMRFEPADFIIQKEKILSA